MPSAYTLIRSIRLELLAGPGRGYSHCPCGNRTCCGRPVHHKADRGCQRRKCNAHGSVAHAVGGDQIPRVGVVHVLDYGHGVSRIHARHVKCNRHLAACVFVKGDVTQANQRLACQAGIDHAKSVHRNTIFKPLNLGDIAQHV